MDIDFTVRNAQVGAALCALLRESHPHQGFASVNLDIAEDRQVDAFLADLRARRVSYDVVVNNAAVKIVPQQDAQNAQRVLDLNFKKTVALTEKLAERLSARAKIIQISSNYGQLCHQQDPIRSVLARGDFDGRDDLFRLADAYVEELRRGTVTSGFYDQSYFVSKCLLNAYVRHVGRRVLRDGQQMYAVHPGWCRTDMGGPDADLSAAEGATSTLRVALELPFERDDAYNCKFFDEKGELMEW